MVCCAALAILSVHLMTETFIFSGLKHELKWLFCFKMVTCFTFHTPLYWIQLKSQNKWLTCSNHFRSAAQLNVNNFK